jgi:hypothetical protein
MMSGETAASSSSSSSSSSLMRLLHLAAMVLLLHLILLSSPLAMVGGAGSTSNYISYASLKKDSTPCTVPGSGYGDCSTASAANPYNPSCTQYTTCYHATN